MSDDNKKLEIALEFINKVLEAIDKEPIDDLEDFKDIPREDILQVNQLGIDNEKDLYKYFDRAKCGYYRRRTNTYLISILRGICKSLDYNFSSKNKEIYKKIDGKNYRISKQFYTITK